MKTVPFIKMHGACNDFVIVDCRAENFLFSKEDIEEICNRNKGIGCDQFVLLKYSEVADIKVEFYNGDGSKSGACGNASRCIASLVMMQLEQPMATLETDSGILQCYATGEFSDNGEELVTVNMGTAKYGWQDIPLAREMDTLYIEGLGAGDLGLEFPELRTQNLSPSCVSMGNPHCVFFVDNIKEIALEKYGPALEHHQIFPQRANIEIADIISKSEINLRVWERGSGETLACGSGACAAVATGLRRKILSNKVKVHLPGGDLIIEIIENGEILMTGPVAVVFTGVIEL